MSNPLPHTTQLARGATNAIGGSRLFAQPLHVGRPNLADREKLLARFGAVLDRGWLTNNGPNVQEFEKQVADYLGVRHCVAVSNATIGLQLVIHALGLKGEVIVPSFTFAATAHALAWQGVRPVFCDVDPNTHNVDPQTVDALIGPETTGILGVHLWGNPCAIDKLTEIAERRGLALVFDAAHAFGCSHNGRMIGNFGRAEVFSFHATKFLCTGEGGAITTNDDELADHLTRLRNFGIDDERSCGLGINGKMNELAAAMGLAGMEGREDVIAQNHFNLAAYAEALADVRGLQLFTIPTLERRNHQYIVVDVDPAEARMSRDDVVAALHAENVLAKRYFSPGCHRLEPYRAEHHSRRTTVPHTERLCERLLQLPTGTSVGRDGIARIGRFLQNLTTRAKRAA
jgi:dTDP-4-amino-4,6-dideoxygalactose transaminase